MSLEQVIHSQGLVDEIKTVLILDEPKACDVPHPSSPNYSNHLWRRRVFRLS